MVLSLSPAVDICEGHSPSLLHLGAVNEGTLLYVGVDGKLYSCATPTLLGDWTQPFGASVLAVKTGKPDIAVTKLTSKQQTRRKAWISWQYDSAYLRCAMYPFDYNPSPITHSGQTGKIRPV